MFRLLIVFMTLLGMTLCQYRCKAAGDIPQTNERSTSTASCDCCHPERESAPHDEAPTPCCPNDDGSCHCQGICGGALTAEPLVLDEMAEGLPAALDVALSADSATQASLESRNSHAGRTLLRVESGWALRVLLQSIQT